MPKIILQNKFSATKPASDFSFMIGTQEKGEAEWLWFGQPHQSIITAKLEARALRNRDDFQGCKVKVFRVKIQAV